MITTAVCIIAVCEIIKAIQNAIQLHMMGDDTDARQNAYAEFVKSLKQDDKEFVKRLLEEFEDGEQ